MRCCRRFCTASKFARTVETFLISGLPLNCVPDVMFPISWEICETSEAIASWASELSVPWTSRSGADLSPPLMEH